VTTTASNITRGMTLAEESAGHAHSEARSAGAHQAHGETTGPIARPAGAGLAPERPGNSQGEITACLLNDASTAQGQAYARAFSDTAATHVRELRERDPLPEPDRTPGASHPDPFLASRGWHMNQHGIYTRRTEPTPPCAATREGTGG
jgi:hypothetical protein